MPDEPSLSRRRHAPKGPLKSRTHPMEARRPMDDTPQQCTAHSKQSGERCKRPAIAGGKVCYMHGGAAPHVQEAAMARLHALQDPAIDALQALIAQTEFPSVRYASSRDVLDRTLGKAVETVEIKQAVEDLPDDDLIAEMRALLARVK